MRFGPIFHAAGAKLGPYEFLAPIVASGMGRVYKARDTRLGRVVAIKVSDERFTARSEREARAVAALNHPDICTLYDVGPNYLVMEFVDGAPIATTNNFPSLLDLAIQTADGLAAGSRARLDRALAIRPCRKRPDYLHPHRSSPPDGLNDEDSAGLEGTLEKGT